jgi:hypothetical protein
MRAHQAHGPGRTSLEARRIVSCRIVGLPSFRAIDRTIDYRAAANKVARKRKKLFDAQRNSHGSDRRERSSNEQPAAG